jgi:hypothetical protein
MAWSRIKNRNKNSEIPDNARKDFTATKGMEKPFRAGALSGM